MGATKCSNSNTATQHREQLTLGLEQILEPLIADKNVRASAATKLFFYLEWCAGKRAPHAKFTELREELVHEGIAAFVEAVKKITSEQKRLDNLVTYLKKISRRKIGDAFINEWDSFNIPSTTRRRHYKTGKSRPRCKQLPLENFQEVHEWLSEGLQKQREQNLLDLLFTHCCQPNGLDRDIVCQMAVGQKLKDIIPSLVRKYGVTEKTIRNRYTQIKNKAIQQKLIPTKKPAQRKGKMAEPKTTLAVTLVTLPEKTFSGDTGNLLVLAT